MLQQHPPFEVRPEWLDGNGHMNMGYYLLAFDQNGTDPFFDYLGLGWDYTARTNHSTFTMGANIDYLSEALAGDELYITTQFIDWNHKCLHFIHCMYQTADNRLVAVNESLNLHVDLGTRKSALIPEPIRERIASTAADHQQYPLPNGAGRMLKIRK